MYAAHGDAWITVDHIRQCIPVRRRRTASRAWVTRITPLAIAEYVLVSAVLVEGSRHRYVRLSMLRRTSDANLGVDLRVVARARRNPTRSLNSSGHLRGEVIPPVDRLLRRAWS